MVTILWSVLVVRIHFRSSALGTPPPWLVSLTNSMGSFHQPVSQQKKENDFTEETNTSVSQSGSNHHDLQKISNENSSTSEKTCFASKNNKTLTRASCPFDQVSTESSEIANNSEEAWRSVMYAADRCLFYVFALTFIVYVLVIIVKVT